VANLRRVGGVASRGDPSRSLKIGSLLAWWLGDCHGHPLSMLAIGACGHARLTSICMPGCCSAPVFMIVAAGWPPPGYLVSIRPGMSPRWTKLLRVRWLRHCLLLGWLYAGSRRQG